MNQDTAAKGFAAMGSESRLRVLRTLVRAGVKGLTVGEIQARTGLAPSTLNHHLKALTHAGLLTQERAGRTIFNRAAYAQLTELASFILSECCTEEKMD
ncbi:MAG: transcriptional regulator [Rhodospirillaceae bacterium TMED8]|nr:transcriptional regulator [Magnetovibrio sp.]OUT47698.1 MAG: transcriptional regulator [Rhodospirillaceae bacterium TMED8]